MGIEKIADFIHRLNYVVPTTEKAHFDATWNGVVVKARFIVDYKTEVRSDILPEEIENADPEAFAVEVAEKMEAVYKERMAMPLLEGSCEKS